MYWQVVDDIPGPEPQEVRIEYKSNHTLRFELNLELNRLYTV